MGNGETEKNTDEDAQSVLLGGVAEEAHEHRHFRMSCRRGGALVAPRSLLLSVDAWYSHLKWKTSRAEVGERW